MKNFNCGNCRSRVVVFGGYEGMFADTSVCARNQDKDHRDLVVDKSDYCSYHGHTGVYDKERYEKYTRVNNTLLSY